MNDLMTELMEQTPRVNPYIMEGLATYYMQDNEAYLDRVLRSASRSFVKGLEYVDCEVCTPREEFLEITKLKNNRRSYDLAQSSIYMMKYNFKFNGVPLPPRYIYLLDVGPAGTFKLGGSLFHLIPVLSDKVISPSSDSIFVRLLRDRINFNRCYHTIFTNNVTDTMHVVWAQIYRKPKDNKRVPATTDAHTCCVHYLFAKYGFTGAFQKYCGFVPIFGGEEIDEINYPADKWVVCKSTGIKPGTFKSTFYEGNPIRLAIPRDRWDNTVKSLVFGLYYVIDNFPNRFKPDLRYLDSKELWTILLGHINLSGHYGEGKLFQKMQEHMNCLDDYVDPGDIERMRERDVEIDSFYGLLMYLLVNFNAIVLNSADSSASMFGKSLDVLYYVNFDITSGIFRVNFNADKILRKRGTLTERDIVECFNKNWKPGSVFGLSGGRIVAEAVGYSGDHMFPKITARLAEQESVPGASRRGGKQRLVVTDRQHLHASQIVSGSVLFLAKSNPTPTAKINPFACIDLPTATIVPNPKLVPLMELTARRLAGADE